jgi:hypothetical protein
LSLNLSLTYQPLVGRKLYRLLDERSEAGLSRVSAADSIFRGKMGALQVAPKLKSS